MFSKILGSLKGSQASQDTKLDEKISRMDMHEMRVYVNGGLDDFPVDEYGLHEIVKKLMTKLETSEKYYIDIEDMDSKKKRAFDLITLILEHKKVSIAVIESIQEFLNLYEALIIKYDTDNKQIYESRIKKMISQAIEKISMKARIINVMELGT